ncbi:MAG TPA: CoA pyrophosphatase [Beijerinckiaceae bacterium]|jgi:8-oxo-dGTP pyrophosphatase MutT (NUDIX family)
MSETISFFPDDVLARIRSRLTLDLPADAFERPMTPRWSDYALNVATAPIAPPPGTPAAVLVPIVARAEGATLLLTQRQARLRAHAGQIAFPGGRIDPDDRDPVAAALREAREEIALAADVVTPLGYLDPYQTGTGYRIAPVVALVRPPFELALCEAEVADAFEVPMSFLMRPENHQTIEAVRDGRRRMFYAMPYEGRNIWGATAGMLRNLYERLYL